MNSIQNHQIHQAIIAREIIDIYKFAPNKTDVAESLDVICFAMARLTEKKLRNWLGFFSDTIWPACNQQPDIR